MSGVVKFVKKVFTAVVSVVKAVIKPLIVIAAVYFTAGLAIGAFSPGLAAALPGFAGAGGAGTGIFSTLASHLGVSGMATIGAANTAAAAAATAGAAAGGAIAAGGDMGGAGVLAAGSGAATGGSIAVGGDMGGAGVLAAGSGGAAAGAAAGADLTAAGSTAFNTAVAGGSTAGSVVAGGGGGAASGWAAMSLSDKLLIASTGSKLVSGLLAPSPEDVARANKTWVGAFYGVDANGAGAAPAAKSTQPTPKAADPVQATTTLQPQVGLTPGSQVASTLPTSATGAKAVPADVANARNLIATNAGAASANQGGAPPAGSGYQFGVEGQPQAPAGSYQFGANGAGASNLIPTGHA